MNVADADARTIGDYLDLIWRFRWLVVGIALIAGVLALASSLLSARSYESTVTFAATQSKLGEGGQISPNTASFRPMVESLTIAADVIRELSLDKSPYNLAPSKFLDVIDVTEIRGTSLLTVKVAMGDPALAARIANSVADHAVNTARAVAASEARYTRDLIKKELDLSQTRLDTASSRLRDYRSQARLEVLIKEVETRLGGPQSPVFSAATPTKQPGTTSTTTNTVFVDAQSASRLSVLDLQNRIASEKARLSAMDRNDATTATVRANLAALEQQRAEMLRTRALDAGTIALLDRLYSSETELSRRQTEHDLAERAFVDLSVRYQEALLQVIGKSAEFVIVDPAVPADRPASRHAARNTAVAAAVWLALAMAGVLMWDSVQRRRLLP